MTTVFHGNVTTVSGNVISDSNGHVITVAAIRPRGRQPVVGKQGDAPDEAEWSR